MLIRFHSFTDLITNSSSTVYIYLTEKTEEVIKDLVRLLLSRNGSNETFDSLFSIEHLTGEGTHEYDFYENIYDIESIDGDWEALEKAKNEAEDKLAYLKKYAEEHGHSSFEDENYHEYDYASTLKITAKHPKDAAAAKILSSLRSLFEYEAVFDG